MDLGIPTLHTERLTLRAFDATDFDAVAAFFAHPSSSMYGGLCERWEAWRKLAAYLGHWVLMGFGPFALEETATGSFVGWTGMWAPEGWPEPEITWALLPEHVGRGFATEGARRSLQSAYEDFGWETAISLINERNAPSIAVAERLGARLERSEEVLGNPGLVYRHVPPDELT
jgi:RimJ/RimL family protein N-acetyltransferase